MQSMAKVGTSPLWSLDVSIVRHAMKQAVKKIVEEVIKFFFQNELIAA